MNNEFTAKALENYDYNNKNIRALVLHRSRIKALADEVSEHTAQEEIHYRLKAKTGDNLDSKKANLQELGDSCHKG